MRKLNLLLLPKARIWQIAAAVFCAVAFAVAGVVLLWSGRADSVRLVLEPEQGSVSAGARKESGQDASGGQFVRFSSGLAQFQPIRMLHLENGQWFDGVNGSVVPDNSLAYQGSRSAKVTVSASSINRGWLFADTSDYCKGVFAPVGSERWIGMAVYVQNPSVHRMTRLVALSYNPSDCGYTNGGSIFALNLDQGQLILVAYQYQSGANLTQFSPRVPLPANKWVYLQIGIKTARDGAGWGELVVDGVSKGRVAGQTLKTTEGDYNNIQFGGGWSQPGTPITPLWVDDMYIAPTRRQ